MSSNLNIRAQSDAQSEVVGKIGAGETVEVLAEVAAKDPNNYQGYVTIPSSVNGYGTVASIAAGAFKDCGVALTRVDIPSGRICHRL